MAKFILGKKVRMTQIFNEDGTAIPVTIVEAGPIAVTQVKRENSDGYNAVQVEFDNRRREFRVEGDFEKGSSINVEVFEPGDTVKVSGLSKGRGFQGVMKRHGFHGAPATHGTKHAHREPGSIGAVWPQRVLKGTRMAGRMGNERIAVKNLKIVKIDPDKNFLYIKGAVPGSVGSFLEIIG